jgi:hypothetical protein
MDWFLSVFFALLYGAMATVFILLLVISLAARESRSKEENGLEIYVQVAFLWVALPVVLMFLSPWFLPYQQWGYKLHNVVTPESFLPLRVYSIVEQPHDCAFWTAPLGSNHCHYEPVIRLQPGRLTERWSVTELFLGPESRRTVT